MEIKGWQIALLIIVPILLIQLIGSALFDIVRVSEREVAVITRFGQVKEVVTSGWRLKTAYIDSHSGSYDTSVQTISVESTAATLDQQAVKIKVNLQYQIDGSKALEIYKKVQNQKYLNESIIPPFIQEATKSSSAKFSASDLLSKRDQFKLAVEESLQLRIEEYHANVVAVNIENIDWSEDFDRAIENKVRAQQEVLTKEQELKKVEVDNRIKLSQTETDNEVKIKNAETDAQNRITNAEASSKAFNIQGEALKANPAALELERLYRWDGKLPQVQGSPSTIISLPSGDNK